MVNFLLQSGLAFCFYWGVPGVLWVMAHAENNDRLMQQIGERFKENFTVPITMSVFFALIAIMKAAT